MSSLNAIRKPPQKELRNASSSVRTSTPEPKTPPLSRQAAMSSESDARDAERPKLATNVVIPQADVVDARGATFTNIGQDQINIVQNYHGMRMLIRSSSDHYRVMLTIRQCLY